MPGMNSGLNAADPTVVAAFRAALLHQGLIALAIFAVLSIVWVSVRERTENAASAAPQTAHPSPPGISCCGSASAFCGCSTGCCRPSRRWPQACRRR